MTAPVITGATGFRSSVFPIATPRGFAERAAAAAGAGAAQLLSTSEANAGGDKVQAFVAQFRFTDEQRKEIDSQRKVLGDLEQAARRSVQDRKSAAAERVARIKQELELLKRFAGIDPKAAARRAAQLARELGAAAKEYVSAGGSAAAGPTAGAGTAESAGTAAGAATASAGTESVAVEAGSGGEGQIAAAGSSDQSGAAGKADAGADGKTKTDANGAPAAASADGRQRPAEAGKDKDAAWPSRLSAEARERAAEAKADSEFASQVKSLAAQLKAIIERAAKAARKGTDDTGASEGRQALREAEDAATAIQGAALSALSGATGIAAPPATLISISV